LAERHLEAFMTAFCGPGVALALLLPATYDCSTGLGDFRDEKTHSD
jgi:hypothetical protein